MRGSPLILLLAKAPFFLPKFTPFMAYPPDMANSGYEFSAGISGYKDGVLHRRLIVAGGYGDVHEVSHSYVFMSTSDKCSRSSM